MSNKTVRGFNFHFLSLAHFFENWPGIQILKGTFWTSFTMHKYPRVNQISKKMTGEGTEKGDFYTFETASKS